MVSSLPTTSDAYIAGLAADAQKTVKAARALVRKHIPKGYEESMDFGMITWSVPLARYPKTYNGKPLMYVALAAQKKGSSLYLMGIYSDAAESKRFEKAYAASGKKLDMGKSCVRFSSFDDLATDVVAAAISGTSVDAFIARYEASRAKSGKASAPRASKSMKPSTRRSSK
jgi:hypothetical protein